MRAKGSTWATSTSGAPPSAGRSTETRAIIMPVLERERDMTAHARNRGDHAQKISALSPPRAPARTVPPPDDFSPPFDIQSASSTICFRPENLRSRNIDLWHRFSALIDSSRSGLTSGHEEPRLEATIVAAKPASDRISGHHGRPSRNRWSGTDAIAPRRAARVGRGELRSGRAGTRVGRVRGRNDDPALRLAHGAHAASCSSRAVGSVNRRVDPGRMGSAPNEKQVLAQSARRNDRSRTAVRRRAANERGLLRPNARRRQ